MSFVNSVENFAHKVGSDVSHAAHDAEKAGASAVHGAVHGVASGLSFLFEAAKDVGNSISRVCDNRFSASRQFDKNGNQVT